MAQKDFKVKKGLIVGGNITSGTGGFVFDYTANSLSVAGDTVALTTELNQVQDNVASIIAEGSASIVQDNLNIAVSNVISNTNTVSSNVSSLETSVNTIFANVNAVQDNVASVSSDLVSFGTFANSTFTTNTHIDTKIAEVVNGSPELLNTLNELANAIGDDPNFAATLSTQIGSLESNVTAIDTRSTANINTVSSNVSSLETSVNTIVANVNAVQDNVSSISDGSTAFTGAVTFNDNISADRAILNTQLQLGSNVSSGVGSGSTTVFTFPGATYRGVELLMMVQDVTNSEYQLSKILVIHDGGSVYTTEYGVIHTGSSDLATFSAAIDGSDVVTISSAGGSANKKITVASHYLIQ